ncbi:MAG: nascent polypeptide-associated complex subunit family protein [archaeon]|nr:nascent polypeptide-associated complex subunit family protein [archaeon]
MSESTDAEILEARKKMEEKFGNLQIGGKGSQRRKKEAKHRGAKIEQDKKIQAIAKKSGARKLNEISEVNIFKDDNNVVHIKNPTVEYSPKEKATFVSGVKEEKPIKEYLPGILKQLGPKQYEFVKDYAKGLRKEGQKEKKDEEAPELVEDFEDYSKKPEDKK